MYNIGEDGIYLRSRILSVVSDASCAAPSTSSIVADALSVIESQPTGFQLCICSVPVQYVHHQHQYRINDSTVTNSLDFVIDTFFNETV